MCTSIPDSSKFLVHQEVLAVLQSLLFRSADFLTSLPVLLLSNCKGLNIFFACFSLDLTILGRLKKMNL